jgi:predicted 3-demethylubiquinone-9 3-methyltransferase (glyoxalase superfamily)
MQKIVPCLWFDKEAEEAIKFYIGIFNSAPSSLKNSMIVSIQRYPEEPSNIPVKGM